MPGDDALDADTDAAGGCDQDRDHDADRSFVPAHDGAVTVVGDHTRAFVTDAPADVLVERNTEFSITLSVQARDEGEATGNVHGEATCDLNAEQARRVGEQLLARAEDIESQLRTLGSATEGEN